MPPRRLPVEKTEKQKAEFYERFKKRIAHSAQLAHARKQASDSQAKLEAMPPATKYKN